MQRLWQPPVDVPLAHCPRGTLPDVLLITDYAYLRVHIAFINSGFEGEKMEISKLTKVSPFPRFPHMNSHA